MTPTTTKALIDAGYQVTVERSTQRIFDGKFSLCRCDHAFANQLGCLDQDFADVWFLSPFLLDPPNNV